MLLGQGGIYFGDLTGKCVKGYVERRRGIEKLLLFEFVLRLNLEIILMEK